jgi:hypothetical protein
MGGTATFDYVEPINGFVVAMSGDFDGGVFARVVGAPRRDGVVSHYDLEHFFMRADGSTIQTRDVSRWVHVDGDDRVLAETTDDVVKGTGAFAGMVGRFRSWGSVNPATGQGVLRFWGEIGDPDTVGATG